MSTSTNDNDVIGAISSPLEISDDEIASMSFEDYLSKYGNIPDDEEESTEEGEEESVDDENNSEEVTTEEEPKKKGDKESSEEEESSEETKEESKDEEENTEDKSVDKDSVIDQTEYTKLKEVNDKIFAEFKANGKTIKVDNVDQVISLMQMGANYTQKMTQIKPQLKTLQMLEAHGIKDESQLSFLIDLHKKDPAAIAKLIKDADINPHQLDVTEADKYTGSDYSITYAQFDFKTVTEELRLDTSLEYAKLMQAVQTFDNKSKTAILDNPLILKDLSEHYKDGTYASVMAEVDRRKILGDSRLNAMPLLDAYVTVGQEMANNKKLPTKAKEEVKAEVVASKAIAPKAKTNPTKKIASNVSGTTTNKASEEINFLAMTDEEFEAYTKSQKVLRK